MNGNIIGFGPQTQKLESHYKNSIRYSGSERVKQLNGIYYNLELSNP